MVTEIVVLVNSPVIIIIIFKYCAILGILVSFYSHVNILDSSVFKENDNLGVYLLLQ